MATILIVDDRPTNRRLLMAVLRQSGHQLLDAADGAEALVIARAHHPDLIITDILMPTMDGYELVQHMRADPLLAHTPVIFYTATYNAREARALAQASGVQYVLAKPVDPAVLRETVHAALGMASPLPPAAPPPVPPAPPLVEYTQLSALGDRLDTYFSDLRAMHTQLTRLIERGAELEVERARLRQIAEQITDSVVQTQAMSLRLAAFVELGFNLVAERDPQRMLDMVVHATRRILDTSIVAIGILSPDERALERLVLHGPVDPPATLPAITEGLLHVILTQQRAIRVPDLGDDLPLLGLPLSVPPPYAFLGVPIATTTRQYGLLYCVGKVGAEAFTADDESAALTIATEAAVLYENAQLYDQLQRHAATLQLEVTERQRAEAALAHERDLLHVLMDHSPDMIYFKDRASRFTRINRAQAALLEVYDPTEAIGKSDFDFQSPALAQTFYAEEQTMMQTGAPILDRIEYNPTADGKPRWLSATKVPLKDPQGRVEGLVGIARDVTERYQRERELAAIAVVSSALRTATDRTAMLPIMLDQTMSLLTAAGAALVLYDQSREMLVCELARGIWAERTGEHIPAGTSMSNDILATGQPHVNNSGHVDPRYIQPTLVEGLPALAGVPLIAREQPIGVLWIGRTLALLPEDVRVLTAIADIAANALQRAALHEQTQQRLRRLAALRAIDLAIIASPDLARTLAVCLEQVTGQLGVDAADVLLLDPETQTLSYAAGTGFRTMAFQSTRRRLGKGWAGRAMLERRTVALADVLAAGDAFDLIPLLENEGLVAYYGVPLIAKGQVEGILEVFHRTPLAPDQEWFDFLETLAEQVAIAVDNATLVEHLRLAHGELTDSYERTLVGWVKALDLRDKETEGHTQRVTAMTLRLAEAMGLDAAELVHVRWGALLHDIGKLGIPDEILLKPGRLTEEEWVVMRRHPIYAYEWLAPITYLRGALDIPYAHHEKWDGSGYPRGLAGEQIPLAARLFAVADVWDAMRSDRPYRKGWPEVQVREHIRTLAGTHFDPDVVALFLRVTAHAEVDEMEHDYGERH